MSNCATDQMGAKEKFISVSSDDRFEGSVTSFSVDLKDTFLTQTVRSVVPYMVQIPHLFYNIRSSYEVNNVLSIRYSNVIHNITLPEGQYTLSQIIPALTALINDALPVGNKDVVITSSPNTFQLTFTFLLAVEFMVSSMFDPLGFETQTALNVEQTAPLPINLQGITMIYLHSPEIGELHTIDPGRSGGYISMIAPVSLHDTPFGGTAYFQANEVNLADIVFTNTSKNISIVRFVLRTSRGTVVQLPNNHNIQIVLKVLFL
tara:strand:+ start:182 stop:967 length:786 start_codon:yes stop_codon:yes gene_type:complete